MDILAIHNTPDTIAARTRAVHEAMLSVNFRQPNFEQIGTDDLAALFGLYDRDFFDGWLSRAVQVKTDRPLTFRLSSTMTRAGGKTILYQRRKPGATLGRHYEIAIASRMLFMNFQHVDRSVAVCGLPCNDRLDALQRIMEHEIIHLAELVTWDKSSCRAARFKQLAANIFGHAGTTHALVTPGEYAAVRHGIRPGCLVSFEFDGCRLVGRVNRIHRRATVLVEDPDGMRYSDGKTYSKYYIPLDSLGLLPEPPSPVVR